MSCLLDVSLLPACGWRSHQKHADAWAWLQRQTQFVTNPLSQLGFIRVSMSPGYRASFSDAQTALQSILGRKQARFFPAALAADTLPLLQSHADVTDAYLVAMARDHGLKLATLDDQLCRQPWALGVAQNPL